MELPVWQGWTWSQPLLNLVVEEVPASLQWMTQLVRKQGRATSGGQLDQQLGSMGIHTTGPDSHRDRHLEPV